MVRAAALGVDTFHGVQEGTDRSQSATFDAVEMPRQQMIDTTLPGIIELVLEPGTRTACARFDVRMDCDDPQTEVSCKAAHGGFLGFQRRALLVWSQRQTLVQTGGLLRRLRESPG